LGIGVFFEKIQKKNWGALSTPKSVKVSWLVKRMGQKFDDYPVLQQKSKCA
jgi:hypothetical protein